jgi:hypothetical protein
MNKEEMIRIACVAIRKNYDYETLKYSDDMYNLEEFSDNIWEYVEECKQIGKIAFKEKYKEYKLLLY